MRAAVRESDTVARISGDEFVILLEDLDDPGQAEHIAKKVRAALSAHFQFAGQAVPLSASIGLCTTCGEETQDADTLLRCVDAALYQAKASGRNCVQSYIAQALPCNKGAFDLEECGIGPAEGRVGSREETLLQA